MSGTDFNHPEQTPKILRASKVPIKTCKSTGFRVLKRASEEMSKIPGNPCIHQHSRVIRVVRDGGFEPPTPTVSR